MNRIIAVLILFMGFGLCASAQVNPRALGIRGGSGNLGVGGEVSYQHGLSENNRLELDLGWRGNNGGGNNYFHMAVSGIYHWVFNIEQGFNWYVGPGAQLGLYNDRSNSVENGATLGVGGQIGIEYDFNAHDVPLLLGLDTRPMWGFVGGTAGFGYGGAFSLRYTF